MLIMNGKTLKVVEYNLSFGSSVKMVNVFGVFRYKPNNNLYIIYADINTQYPIIYYGSSHIKENSILSMACSDPKVEEIIKEYIFKTISKETLTDFEIISLDSTEGVEIISSNKLEVKPEVLNNLVDIAIPKPKVEEEVPIKNNKKKSSKKTLLFFLIILFIGGGGYFYLKALPEKETTVKLFVCAKNYQHDILSANVSEENTYHFNNQEKLEYYNTITTYQFFSQEEYQDFISKGTIYRYMPGDEADGGWDKDDQKYLFKVMVKKKIDTSYNLPTNYEEALAHYKKEGYTCEEKIEE